MYFEIYQEPTGLLGASLRSTTQWRWRLKSANHEIIASGEGYNNKIDCQHAIDLLKGTTHSTPVKDAAGSLNALATALRNTAP